MCGEVTWLWPAQMGQLKELNNMKSQQVTRRGFLKIRALGKTGMDVSVLSYGVSPFSSVFDEAGPKFRFHFYHPFN